MKHLKIRRNLRLLYFILSHQDFNLPYRCHADACQCELGGPLKKFINGEEKAIFYFPRKFNDAPIFYSASDREILGPVQFVTYFRCYLEGTELNVVTGNKVLKHSFEKKDPSLHELDGSSYFLVLEFSQLLGKGDEHVIGDVLSLVTHESRTVCIQKILKTEWNPSDDEQFKNALRNDQLFGQVVTTIEENVCNEKYSY